MVWRDDVEVDLSSVKHTVEPLGPVDELDGLSMTRNHLSDLLQCRLRKSSLSEVRPDKVEKYLFLKSIRSEVVAFSQHTHPPLKKKIDNS